jgi:molecular chaperone DnaK
MMVREAEANASEDTRRRQEIELRNQTDSLTYSTERALAEHGAKLSDAERSAIEQAVNEAREALRGEDVERIRRAQDGLTRASQTLAEGMRREPTGGRVDQRPGEPGDGDVVDAEFEDTNERKAS